MHCLLWGRQVIAARSIKYLFARMAVLLIRTRFCNCAETMSGMEQSTIHNTFIRLAFQQLLQDNQANQDTNPLSRPPPTRVTTNLSQPIG